MREWGLGAVLLSGLLDGINPCAFTAIALLLSWLTAMGRTRGHLLVIGGVFCFSVFGTYLALGVCLSQLLCGLQWLGVAGQVVRWLVIAVTFIFALACGYDTYMAARQGGAAMLLKLPAAVEARVRGTIRHYAKTGGLVLSTIGLGVTISLLEGVCTGQLYLPTISYLAGIGTGWYVLAHLALYNAAFIAPLAAVFLAVSLGVSSKRFAAVYRRAMPVVKGAMCGVFLAMTGLLVLLETGSLRP